MLSDIKKVPPIQDMHRVPRNLLGELHVFIVCRCQAPHVMATTHGGSISYKYGQESKQVVCDNNP